MTAPINLPESLYKIRDEIVDNVLNNLSPPLSISLIKEWLDSDGIDNFWSPEGLQGNVIDLASLAQSRFYDSELEYSKDIYLTDKLRVDFARKFISEIIENGIDTFSVHAIKLEKENGKLVYLGCIKQSQGMSDSYCNWNRLYKTIDDFLNDISNFYVFVGEVYEISDEKILSLWNKDI